MIGQHHRTKITPPALAARWGVKQHKILAWIRSGELRAINAAERLGGRPRYLIDEADIAAFEVSRAAGPTPQPARRRRRQWSGVIEFF